MHLCLLTLEFRLPGCGSLKEKRRRLAGIKDKFGRIANIAVSETDFHDDHDRAEWSFVGIASDRKSMEKLLGPVENYAATQVDAVIAQHHKQYL